MIVFNYTARTAAGQFTHGQVQAEDRGKAAEWLRGQGLFVTGLEAAGGAAAERQAGGMVAHFLFPLWSGVGPKDKAIFYRQLVTMLAAGMPLYQALTTMAQGLPNKRLASVLEQIAQDVLAGGRISEAMARFPWIFTRLELRMVNAGEVGGLLENVLNRLADYMEREWQLRLKIAQRTLYPRLVFLAFIFIPPIPTLVLAGPGPYFASIVLTWGPILLLVFGLWIFFRYLLQSQAVRDFYDQVKLAIPVVGPLVRKLAIARFARSMAALYGAGVSPSSSLATAAETAGNAVLERNLRRITPAIEKGASLSESMTLLYFFPPMFTGMVSTGEQTGNLDQMLDKAAEYYENEATHATMQLVVILGVVLLLIMAVVVAITVIGFYTGYAGRATDGGSE